MPLVSVHPPSATRPRVRRADRVENAKAPVRQDQCFGQSPMPDGGFHAASRGKRQSGLDIWGRSAQDAPMKLLPLVLLCASAAAAAAEPPPVADFLLPDVNPDSDRLKATSAPLSPRNYLNQVSAFYFAHEG